MRLYHVRPSNFRCFGSNSARLRLHENLTVLVGPNEAGKTSLLSAISRLTSTFVEDDVRDGYALEDCNVEFRILLDEETKDRVELEIGQRIESFEPRLKATGGSSWTIFPEPPERDPEVLEAVLAPLIDVLDAIGRDAGTLVAEVREFWKKNAPQDDDREPVLGLLGMLDAHEADDEAGLAPLVSDLRELVKSRSPFHEATRALRSRFPTVLEFAGDQRGLLPRYERSEAIALGEASSALTNLLGLAQLTSAELSNPRPGRVDRALQTANERIRAEFASIWGENQPYPQIGNGGSTLDIYVADPFNPEQDGLPIDLRSAGVRWMIELVSFIGARRRSEDEWFVLLADEIEQHLHYDAQIGLVEWLDLGIPKVQVVCTTHSVGCWPADIGSQMNALARADGETKVFNGPFSTGIAGSESVLAAIGASRANFALNRPVVFCEGAIDEMLLPFVFRQSGASLGGASFIGSIAQSKGAAHPNYPSLPGEAFLLDFDDGGEELRKQLVEGDPARQHRIFSLTFADDAWSSRTTEDLLDLDHLSAACASWCTNAGVPTPKLSDEAPVVPQLKVHLQSLYEDAKKRRQRLSSLKTFVAHDLAGRARDGERIVRAESIASLHQLWERVDEALQSPLGQ